MTKNSETRNSSLLKKHMKKAVLLLLVLAMGLSLCACGSGGSSESSGNGNAAETSSAESAAGGQASSKPEATATAAAGTTDGSDTPSTVYKATFTALTGDADISYMSPQYWTDTGVYCTGTKIIGSRAPADAEPQYYGQFDITEPAVYFVSYDGSVRELENYVPVSTPSSPDEIELNTAGGSGTENAAGADGTVVTAGQEADVTAEAGGAADGTDAYTTPEADAATETGDAADGTDAYTSAHPCEGVYEYTASTYCGSLNVLPDGNLFVCDSVYLSWVDTDPEGLGEDEYYDHYIFRQYTYLRTLDVTGKELSSIGMEIPATEWMYTQGYSDTDGNILFIRSTETGEYYLTAVIPATGETAYEIKSENSLNSICRTTDGTVYVLAWGDTGTELLKFDPETKTLKDPMAVPNEAYTVIAGGGAYPFYYTSGVYCYGFDPAAGEESVRLFSWMDCDMDSETASYNMAVDGNGTVRVLVDSFDSYTMTYDRSLAMVQETPYDASTQKQELTLATQYLSYELRNAVVDFNRKSDTTRIVVRDYSEYNTEDDYSAGLTKLQTEIMGGNCPDLIDMSGLSLSQLAGKGLLEDLYPYLDSDPELSRDDYYANVLSAAESDGKLMHTVSYFCINTAAGAAAIVGDEPGWTYQELENALQDMPEGCEPFDASITRDEILNTCLNLDMSDYVNWSTGEVNFDSENFIELLKFAEQFPESFDWETYDWQTDSAENRIADGRQMLYATAVSSIDTLNYLEGMYNGTPVTFIGYPTNNGTGNTIEVDSGYAMSYSCADKEAAWQFLRTFFTASYFENNAYYGLPAQKELLEKKLKKACTPTYEIDENGEYKLDANGERIMEEHYYAFNSAAYTYYALSQDMADRFMNLLNTTTKVSVIDESIKDIVSKQVDSYFSGQKSAEEVAQLVQNNVKIYVNEQR